MAVISLITGYIVPFLFVLTILVFVHEMGHYLVGRWCGIRATAFAIGFGPELTGFTDKHGTRWKLCAIPLGGYVKFWGDEDAASRPGVNALEGLTEEERSHTLSGAKLWKRAATVAAGPIANFLLAILIFSALFSLYGKPVSDPVVSEVKPGSAAEEAGIVPGDVLLALDDTKVVTFYDVRRYVSIRPGTSIVVKISRNGEERDLPMVPRATVIDDPFGNKVEVGLIGILTNADVGKFRVEKLSVPQAIGESFSEIGGIVSGTFRYIGNILTGKMKADQLGGPVRVAQASGQMATIGLAAVIQLAGVLSVSIGLLNLLPVPVLDGGHLVFYAIEAVRGRPLPPGAQEIAFRIGLAMVLSLMVFATWNDIAALMG